MKNTLRLFTLTGSEISPYLPSIAKLELEVFSGYPYLYDETLSNQIKYLERYAECPKSIMVLVIHGNHVVGMATGIPLSVDTERFKKPFINNRMDIQKIYYLGDSLLLPAYRGKKIYREFFEKREENAIKHGCTICAFVTVERPLSDPRRPSHYAPLDPVWQHFGYTRYPELYVDIEWKDVGNQTPSTKRLVYWLRNLT